VWKSKQGLLNNLEVSLHENFGIVCPDDSSIASDPDNSTALKLVTRYIPEPAGELAGRIMTYRLNEDDEPFMLVDGYDVDIDATMDIVKRNDQHVATDWVGNAVVTTKRTRQKESIDAFAGNMFVGVKYKPKTLTPFQFDLNIGKAQTEVPHDRRFTSIVADASDIEERYSRSGSIDIDIANGRMLLPYAGGTRCFVSWTHRGVESASTAALQTRWRWHEEATGGPCPLPL
jgi:hypothetical protein